MSISRPRSAGHVTSTTTQEIIYVAPAEVEYVEITSIQLARKSASTLDTLLTVRWLDHSEK